MIAEIGRYLHQSIDEVEEWEAERFFRYHDQIRDILADERPE
ncbi:hypothetical protein [Limimaricola hongkongensis]|uniref:Uncharacterized protein n=1 Tax=Limimaricola hongkongensis DSM 17492 TaxID=1122180 RepID=A0A017HBC8_9RHOB|nr:hypothetical protein [Limimaricola hongkongensis]EYD71817.1 hypothetical protein Lokhon_01887 [Limimaricola hongkongensis DSM 17492]